MYGTRDGTRFGTGQDRIGQGGDLDKNKFSIDIRYKRFGIYLAKYIYSFL